MLDLEKQIFHQIDRANSVLIVFPDNWRPDAVASALALFLYIKKIGKTVDLVGDLPNNKPEPLMFLPSYDQITHQLENIQRFVVSVDIGESKISQIKYTIDEKYLNFIISPATGWFKPENVSARAGEFKYDLIITVGAPDLESLGKLYDDHVEFFYKTTILNIDNQSANEEFGQINYINLSALSVSEIIFYLLKTRNQTDFDENISTCLLAGIIFESRNFKNPNLVPGTLLAASELIAFGGRREEIINHLYRSRSLSSLKLWGKILNNLQTVKNGELLWSCLSKNDIIDSGALVEEISDVMDELLTSLPSTKLAAILYENLDKKTELIIYSLKNLNALLVATKFLPSGNQKVATAQINYSLEEAIKKVVPELTVQLDKSIT